jgi:hypothetical protein
MRVATPDIDWKRLRGSYDLGFNATGVIRNAIHFTGDEVITTETMPAEYVEDCMREVAALGEAMRGRRPGGKVRGRIPLPLYRMWRKQWENGPKLYGLLWRAFLNSKLMDSDYKRFRVEGV